MPRSRRTPSRGPSQRAQGPRNTRPGQRGGATRTPKAEESLQRPRFTNRAAVLLVVFAILVVSYASSMRAYLEQRGHISDLKAQIADSKAGVQAAQREKRRWQDPEFVAQQARERFGWVQPGATVYQVLDKDGKPLTGDSELTDPSSVAPDKPTAWWSKVHESMDIADHPEKLVTPTPVAKITAPPESE
jgi:cell division protein FtsB